MPTQNLLLTSGEQYQNEIEMLRSEFTRPEIKAQLTQMKIVLQKVSRASVSVDSQVVSGIKDGYMLLVGISVDDTMKDVEKLSKKVATLRAFDDDTGYGWKKNIKEVQGQILSISQFTLMGITKKGTKPDFHLAQKGHLAKELYDNFLALLRQDLGDDNVKDGVFGAMMSCELVNEGPVTIILDTTV